MSAVVLKNQSKYCHPSNLEMTWTAEVMAVESDVDPDTQVQPAKRNSLGLDCKMMLNLEDQFHRLIQ